MSETPGSKILGYFAMHYEGVYIPGQDYTFLSLVIYASGLWLCIKKTGTVNVDPGSNNEVWVLSSTSAATIDKEAAQVAAGQAQESATQAAASANDAIASKLAAQSAAGSAQGSAAAAAESKSAAESAMAGAQEAQAATEQAAANFEGIVNLVGAGNPNLLDNAYFRNPVNQRGCPIGYYLPAGYGLDRWETTASSFQYVSGGLYVPNAGDCHLAQKKEGSFAGKTLTASVAVGLGEPGWFDSVTLTAPGGGYDDKYFPTLTGVRVLIVDMGSYLEYHFIVENGAMPLSALKLELGTASTLHLDPPMDHAVELPKCQRHFERLKTIVYTGTATNYAFGFEYRVPKRLAIPSVTIVSMNNLESGQATTVTQCNSVSAQGVGSLICPVVANSAYMVEALIASDL